jgi:ferric-dicitrate binding protein FerR (iron transport regulator)
VNSPVPDACIDEAIAWIARLRAHDVSTDDRSRFAEWLASDVTHRAALDEIVQLWQRLGVVAQINATGVEDSPDAAIRVLRCRGTWSSITEPKSC